MDTEELFRLSSDSPGKLEANTKAYMVEWRKQRKQRASTWTYFATDGTAIKIGLALDLPERMSSLNTGNPRLIEIIGIVDGDREYDLLCKFSKHHLKGEWFTLCDEIINWIEENGYVKRCGLERARAGVNSPQAIKALN